MERNITEEKNKKMNSKIKNNPLKEYQKIRNKTKTNYYISKVKNDNNYYKTFDKSSIILNEEIYNSFQQKKENSRTIYNNLKQFKILNFSKERKNNYNNTLNKLFFTTSNILKHKKIDKKKDSIVNAYYNMNQIDDDINGKNRILNKLFPDINEMNKYSNLPFFSLIKRRTPFKMKFNLDLNNLKKRIKQEEFLFKLSHTNDSNEQKLLNINKGIKKGRTTQYFHGVDKFCINNKISEINHPLKESIIRNKFNLQLNVENITRGGEKTPQMNNKEKRIKMLENNVNNIKSIPKELVNGLEEEVFKFLDEEFEKNHIELDKDNENKELEKNTNEKKTEEKNVMTGFDNNINNLNLNFLSNKSTYTNISDINYINPNPLKKPNKYPTNYYSTQQLRKKEHFSDNYKITFEERIKKLNKEKEEKKLNKIKNGLELENIKDLKEKRKINNGIIYRRHAKIADKLIGNTLKNTYDEVDTKRILNGLKPWIFIKSDEKKEMNINILKQKVNEDIKNIL